MPKVTMVQHINVQITNRQRTQEWYENVLGARFRDRGPERNKRQLQLHLGNAERWRPTPAGSAVAPVARGRGSPGDRSRLIEATGADQVELSGGYREGRIGGASSVQRRL